MDKENEIKLYELTQSQDVINLQCKYTLFKRVMNILTSATVSGEVDKELMKEAFNKTIERNDCLRLQFVKKNGKLMQYFLDELKLENIPYIEFKTKEEQEAYIIKYRAKAIKFMKGVEFEVTFCKTYDGKFMILFKIAHLILDLFGINNIYKDLFAVYNALKNKTELPPVPPKYEDVIVKDLTRKFDVEYDKKNRQFFYDYLSVKEKPYYTGLHGKNQPIWQKLLKKGQVTMKMFFINNKTDCKLLQIGEDVIKPAIEFCKENKCSLANFAFYSLAVCESRINGDIKNSMQLELCNCRGTVNEKAVAGTKVQSLGIYTVVDKDRTFAENFADFMTEHNILTKHIGYPDVEFEMLLNKLYKKPLLGTYYNSTFSFLPFANPEGVDIQIYSNGRFVLPSYLALMYDVDKNVINMAYDYQTKIHTGEDIERFHKNYVGTMKQVLKNKDVKVKDIKIEE